MKYLLPTIKDTIAIDSKTFVDQVKETLLSTPLTGWKPIFIVNQKENELTIRTKRLIQYPSDSVVLRGSINEKEFNYEIKPRRTLWILVPWYIFMFSLLIFSIVMSFININGLIPVIFLSAMIFIQWRHIRMNYAKDAALLQQVIDQNKSTAANNL